MEDFPYKNLEEFVEKLPPVDISDLQGLDVKALKVIFNELMTKFRDLIHVFKFESKKCLDFVKETDDLRKELEEREERLREREQRLEDGRFLAEYREEQVSEVQEVYRIEIAPSAPPIDYVPVVKIQTNPTPKRDETVEDGLVSQKIMKNDEALSSLINNIEVLRKLIIHYEEKIKIARETLQRVEVNLQMVKEQEQILAEKEEELARREREAIAESVNRSFIGA
ncbi:unnamed protein product [Bursaphelenchus xylophilus]|uniref:(pine wood nematode) hypothetical protein n=1 Tax=Bursaphelenchus xylophilus TaxID=6326 RepID=A0A1I7SAJ4_BURXY|nr:unnamed protein product [Bursaphelenchus xylophilus]CAG9079335.1 unnamed protein product [Bursaphelenchus xylophilus]